MTAVAVTVTVTAATRLVRRCCVKGAVGVVVVVVVEGDEGRFEVREVVWVV